MTTEKVKNYFTVQKIIYYIMGVVQVFLGFRFLFRLLGANPESPFVNFLYSVSGIFLQPFAAIFRDVPANGLETRSVFELQTLVAMLSYAVITWGIISLINIKVEREVM